MVTHSVHFQRQNDSKISTLIKACRSLSVKNCHAKERELTPRMYSQLQRVDRRSQKISAVCSMLQRQNRSTFWQFTGSATRRHCAWLVSKNILEEKIFASWCLIVKIAKISASWKFPTTQQYEIHSSMLTKLYLKNCKTSALLLAQPSSWPFLFWVGSGH